MIESEAMHKLLASKPGATEEYPFGPGALVFKVGGKMFGLIGEYQGAPSVNLKCDPDEAEALRTEFPGILPGYHMNKRHWNTVMLDGTVPDDVIREMIDGSYDLVVKSLPKAVRETLG